MKKLFAIMLAVMMLFSFTACNNSVPPVEDEKDSPADTQNVGGEAQDTEEPDTEEKVIAPTFSWPVADFIEDYMLWTGSGKIVDVVERTYDADDTGEEFPVARIYIDTATFEEVEAYVNLLKSNGFSYLPFWPGEGAEEEPGFEFSGYANSFDWVGTIPNERYISVTFTQEPRNDAKIVNGEVYSYEYSLVIGITTKTRESGRIAVV